MMKLHRVAIAALALVWLASAALAQTPPVPLGPSGGAASSSGGSGTMTSAAIVAGTNVTLSGTCSSSTAINCTVNAGGAGTPGGTTGQVQFNSAGSFGGFTLSGDCTLVTSTGVITCTSINGKAVTLGGPLTTTGAGTTTLAFGAAGYTYTFPAASITIGAILTNSVATGSAYTFLPGDWGKLVIFSDGTARAPSLPSASFVAGSYINLVNTGAGAETITPTTGTICGNATLVLQQGQGDGITFDGTNWQCSGGPYVTGPSSSTTGDLASYSNTTGQKLQDSGILASTIPGPTTIQTFSVLAKAGTAAVFGAGSGYVTNDTIPIATTGGTCSTAPVLTVTASAGAITALAVSTAGSCTAIPNNNPATQASTSGVGVNGTFVITWAAIAQTYTPTAGMKVVKICELGSGGGAGSGSLQAASTASSGGAGGGGGARFEGTFTAAQIGVSKPVQIGIGSNGGTPPTANSTAGGNGAAPTVGTFFNTGSFFPAAVGGAGAGAQLGATTSGGGAGGGFQNGTSSTGATGGTAPVGGAAGGTGLAGTANVSSLFGGAGGGGSSAAGLAAIGGASGAAGPGGASGGGLTSSSGTNAGQNGGVVYSNGVLVNGGTGGAANTSGNPGTSPSTPTCEAMAGTGGGGGGSAAAGTAAGNGGAGGLGAGGGGGGDAVNTGTAGWGGRGGDGYMMAYEYH